MDLSVVIPVYNEEENVEPLIGEIEAALAALGKSYEIVVVDDGSKDGTFAKLRVIGERLTQLKAVRLKRNFGQTAALAAGLAHARGAVVILMDGDGQNDPADIPLLAAPIRDGVADHVSASRLIGGSSELHGGFDEFFRLAGSSFVTACINWRFGVRLSDSQNGFRAIRTDVLRQLDLTDDQTTIEQELIIKTLKRGFRMAERPSHEHPRRHGQSHIRLWRAAPGYVFSLIRHLF